MKQIAVVGAGMGGLAFAAAMRNSDIEVTVYEQASELGELGAGISLFANGTRLFETLGIEDHMTGRCSEPTAFVFRNEDGSVVADQPLGRGNWYRNEYGSPYYGGLRRDLQSALLDVVGKSKIRLNKQLAGFDDSGDQAKLSWTDGAADTADLVIGADGIKSVLRGWVDDSDVVQFTGNSAFRGLARTADLTLLPEPKTITDWMGDGKHMLTFSVGKDYEYTTIVIFKDGPETWEHAEWRVPADAAALRAEFAGWHPAVIQALDHVNLAERWGMFACKPLPHWYRGRAVLIGDAAHSMMPHHGQGANTTFEDAVVLAQILTDGSQSTLAEKLLRYQNTRKPRAERIQQVSRATNDCLHLPPGPERDRRTKLLHALPKQFAWIHAPGALTEAVS